MITLTLVAVIAGLVIVCTRQNWDWGKKGIWIAGILLSPFALFFLYLLATLVGLMSWGGG